MRIGAKGVAIIKEFEGSRLRAYPDPKTGGLPWTIGTGHTGPDVHAGTVWTQGQADAALVSDLRTFETAVTALIGSAPTTQNQFDALVSFAFNVGAYGTPNKPKLRESTLLRKHLAGAHAAAAAEFGKWINRGTPVEAGLRRRRAAEAALYLS